jgi:N-methylhydantoinase B
MNVNAGMRAAIVADEEILSPATLAVLSNRFEAIVREMTNTLLRSARSAVISVARDFSCSIVSADDELIASGEGLATHIFGSSLQCAELRRLHPDLKEGDAFVDNDPYVGNSHQADWGLMVPVFIDGEHMFTTIAKAHHADIGNANPTTYDPFAKDCYQEGALTFSCVQIQRGYTDIGDIIRMCERRIRVPDQWYGDYLAQVGAARIGERRLKDLVAKYGKDTIRTFIKQWFDYSERTMAAAIGKLPAGTIHGRSTHDAIGPIEAIPVIADVEVDPVGGRVVVDLTANRDSVEAGINLTRATSTATALQSVFNILGALGMRVPHNQGSFRRVEVRLRRGSIAGIPIHPTCTSLATTGITDRILEAVQTGFAEAHPGLGLSGGGLGLGAGMAVIAGHDWRIDGPFVNQMFMGNNGGPATSSRDGWLTWLCNAAAGLLYRDSVELDEMKYPILFKEVRLLADTAGAGRRRGAAASRTAYGPRHDPMTVAMMADAWDTAPKGVLGGLPGTKATTTKIGADGTRESLPTLGEFTILPGEFIEGLDVSGAGYGDPKTREPELVLHDVLEGWVSREKAGEVYGVVFVGEIADDSLAVDVAATHALR